MSDASLSYPPKDTLLSKAAPELLVFTLGAEEYGVDIQVVQELRGYAAVTRIANASESTKGVINLRGIIVPIVDLRIKLGLESPTYDDFTVVVILNLRGKTIGMVVDSVSDVVRLTHDQIKPAPTLSATNTNYLLGVGTTDDRMLLLVDIDKLLLDEEVNVIEKLAA